MWFLRMDSQRVGIVNTLSIRSHSIALSLLYIDDMIIVDYDAFIIAHLKQHL